MAWRAGPRMSIVRSGGRREGNLGVGGYCETRWAASCCCIASDKPMERAPNRYIVGSWSSDSRGPASMLQCSCLAGMSPSLFLAFLFSSLSSARTPHNSFFPTWSSRFTWKLIVRSGRHVQLTPALRRLPLPRPEMPSSSVFLLTLGDFHTALNTSLIGHIIKRETKAGACLTGEEED